MTFDDAVADLRGRGAERVVVTLLPEGTVLRGRLVELDPAGIDGALFGLADGDGSPGGVALALFRDAVTGSRRDGDVLVVRQGEMTIEVAPEG